MLTVAPRNRPGSSAAGLCAYKPKPEQFTFGEFNDEEYYSQRQQHTLNRQGDIRQKILREEANAWDVLWEDYLDTTGELRREVRRRFRQMMLDFEFLCEQDMTSGGLALEEEDARRAIYEAWYVAYTTRVLPAQQAFHRRRVAEQTKLIKDAEAAARRSREAYSQILQTSDDRDALRREEFRSRQAINQEWHDVVMCALPKWAELDRQRVDLIDTELVLRFMIVLEEEETRDAVFVLEANILRVCVSQEHFGRAALEEEERLEQSAKIWPSFLSMRYELWWLTAKDVPCRWRGESITL